MNIRANILGMIEDERPIPAAVQEQSNLYRDLGFDSLGFVALLVRIEDTHSIAFALTEMASCLQVGKLISLVEAKTKERDEAQSPQQRFLSYDPNCAAENVEGNHPGVRSSQ